MPATRILVVDDEPLFGELLSGALAAAAEIEVVAIARDGETAVRLARQALPDAVLMDIELPGRLDGIDAALQIKRERPRTGIVLLSAHLDRRYFTSLPLEEGAGWSYLLKRSVPDLAAVVRAIQGSIPGSGRPRPGAGDRPASPARVGAGAADPPAARCVGVDRSGLQQRGHRPASDVDRALGRDL